MDPSSISPVPTPATTAVPFTTEPNNNHPPLPISVPPPTHPPYAEMIYTAIEALKEKDGSSKRAIGKYIEQVYKEHLPSTHSTLLTHHLKRLKSCGLLQMVKKSYLLPRSAPENATVVAAAQISTPPASRPRGRPRKIQTQAQPQAQNQNIQAQPQAQSNNNNVWAALGLGDEPVVQAVPLEVSKRRPGRPRRSVGAVPAPAAATAASQVGSAPAVGTPGRRGRPPGSRNVRKPGRPPKAVPSPAAAAATAAADSGLPKRRPGRPPKNQQSQPTPIPFAAPAPAAASETVAPVEIPGGDGEVTRSRGRGRPRRNAVPAVAAPVAAVSSGRGRGRGRGSRGGRGSGAGRGRGRGRGGLSAQPGRPGRRPVGRPKKGTTSASAPPNAANEDLKRKLDHFQAKVKESLAALKPHFNHESPVTAIAAIQELEILGTMDLNAPLKDEAISPPQQPELQQQQQQQQLVQQQYPLPPQQQVVYQQQYTELHQYHQQLQQYPQQQPAQQQQQQFHP